MTAPFRVGRGTSLEEERAATAPQRGVLKAVVAIIAIAMSLYHMYVAASGRPKRISSAARTCCSR